MEKVVFSSFMISFAVRWDFSFLLQFSGIDGTILHTIYYLLAAVLLATIPDKTSATLAKFLNKTQVSKHPPPFPHRTMLFMSLKQRSTNPPTLNIDLGGQGGIFLGLWHVFDNFGKMWQVSLMVLSGIVWDYAKIWKFTKLPNSEIIDFFPKRDVFYTQWLNKIRLFVHLSRNMLPVKRFN